VKSWSRLRADARMTEIVLRNNTFNPSPTLTRWIFWSIIVAGVCLPWGVGVWVKLHLQSIGQSTYPWSFFLSPGSILIEVPLTIWFAAPLIVLAILSRYILSTSSFPRVLYWERLLILIPGVLWGGIGMVETFIQVFWVFDPLFFLLIPYSLFYLWDIFVGLTVGCGLAATSVLLRKRMTHRHA